MCLQIFVAAGHQEYIERSLLYEYYYNHARIVVLLSHSRVSER